VTGPPAPAAFPPSRFPSVALLAALVAAAGGSPAPAQERQADPRRTPAPAVDLDRVRVVDLTHTFDEKTLYWPTAPSRFELRELSRGRTDAGFFYSAYALCTPEHGGTHLDAPVHFAERGQAADEVPLERLIGPGIVIDVSSRAAADPDYRLTPADVEAWEKRNGAVPQGAIVLLRTGWSARWPDAKRYLGSDVPGDASDLHFPAYGEAAARLLVERRKAAVLGVDTASIDHGPSQDFPVHRLAAASNVPGLENVARLEELPETGAWVVALPMKIAGGSGGPVRIVALLPGHQPGR
jgi:kynurenine formamidase